MRSYQNPVLIFAAVAIALLPLVYLTDALDAALMPRFTYLGAVTFLMGLGIFVFKKRYPAFIFPQMPVLFLSVFLLSGFAAAIGVIAPSEAWLSMGGDILFFIFFLFLFQVVHGHQIHILIKAVVVLSLLMLGFAAGDLLNAGIPSNLADTYLITGRMGHRNLLASALALCMPFGLCGAWHFGKWWKIAAIIAVLLSLVLVLLLQSRGAVLGLAVFAIAFTSLVAWRSFGGLRMLTTAKSAGLLFGTILLLGFSYLYFFEKPVRDEDQWHFPQDSSAQNFTANERMRMWTVTGEMIFDQPVRGAGPGQWKIFFPKYVEDLWRTRQGMVQFQRPHNDFLWILAEQGIIGLMAFMGFLAIAFYAGLKLLISQKFSTEKKNLVQLMLALLCLYLTVSFFSFPRERIVHQSLLFIAVAVIFAHTREFTKWVAWERGLRPPLAIFSLLILPIIAVGYQRTTGEIHTRKMLRERAAARWPQLLQHYAKVENFSFYKMDPTCVPVDFYAGLAYLNLQELEKAETLFQRAYELHPYNIHVINNLAGTNRLQGDVEKALLYYKEALDVAPHYMDGILNLAAAYHSVGDIQSAYSILAGNEKEFPDNEKERFHLYLTTILSDIRYQLAEQTTDKVLRMNLQNMNEEKLLDLHRTHRFQNIEISEALLKRATKLDSLQNASAE